MSSRKKSDLKNLKISKKKRKIRVKKKAKIVKTCDQLKDDFKDIKSIDMSDGNQLELLKCISNDNREQLQNNLTKYSYLYPYQADPNFNVKITTKKEFNNNWYEEKTREEFDNIKEFVIRPCSLNISYLTAYSCITIYHPSRRCWASCCLLPICIVNIRRDIFN